MSGSVNVIFACPDCRTIYRALQEKTFKLSQGMFNCLDCEAVVHRWTGRYVYLSWRSESVKRPAISLKSGNGIRQGGKTNRGDRGTT